MQQIIVPLQHNMVPVEQIVVPVGRQIMVPSAADHAMVPVEQTEYGVSAAGFGKGASLGKWADTSKSWNPGHGQLV